MSVNILLFIDWQDKGGTLARGVASWLGIHPGLVSQSPEALLVYEKE